MAQHLGRGDASVKLGDVLTRWTADFGVPRLFCIGCAKAGFKQGLIAIIPF